MCAVRTRKCRTFLRLRTARLLVEVILGSTRMPETKHVRLRLKPSAVLFKGTQRTRIHSWAKWEEPREDGPHDRRLCSLEFLLEGTQLLNGSASLDVRVLQTRPRPLEVAVDIEEESN